MTAQNADYNTLFAHVSEPCLIEPNSECDFYGASRLLVNRKATRSLRGFWSHGWAYRPCPFIEQYRFHAAPNEWPTLVHREDERKLLASQGHANVYAIGAPILYCPKPSVQRLANSLLIMPQHTLPEINLHDHEEAYLRMLDSLIPSFDFVGACVHPSCAEQDRWISSLRARNIPVINGASAKDGNGLIRMMQLLARFSHVTSNWIGSHVAYAAYYGCRVSIYGPKPEFARDAFGKHPFYQAHPHILDYFIELENSGYVQSTYDFLFIPPTESRACVGWAEEQLGLPSVLPSDQVADLLDPARASKAAPNRAMAKQLYSILERFRRVR
jgi:hypothetical protein